MLLIFFFQRANLRKVKSYLLILTLALVALPQPVWAEEDWQTTDGTLYQDVHVIRVEDDAITILYKNGGALVPLYKLPANLQQRFDYDPVKAKIAAEKRSKEDAENAAALQREIEASETAKRAHQIQVANQLNGPSTNAP